MTYNEHLAAEWERHRQRFIDAHSEVWTANVRANIAAFVDKHMPGRKVTDIIFGNGTCYVGVDDRPIDDWPEFYGIVRKLWETLIGDAINIDQCSDPFPMDYIESE